MSRVYSQEEVEQILHLALERRSYIEGTTNGIFSQAGLGSIAAELGISAGELSFAEQEWLERQSELALRHDFNRHRWSQFRQRVVKFVIVNSFLALISLVTLHEIVVALQVFVLLWGMKISLDAWKTAQTRGESYEKALQAWRRRVQLQQSASQFFFQIRQAVKGILAG
jgi:hypothetical protein